MNPRRFHNLVRRWRAAVVTRDLGYAVGVAALTAAATSYSPSGGLARWAWPCLTFGVALTIRLAFTRPWVVDAAHLSRHLDRIHPELEESSALWLRAPEQLTLLERLQLKRIEKAALSATNAASSREDFGAPPQGFGRKAAACAVTGLAIWLAVALWARRHPHPPAVDNARSAALPTTAAPSPPATPHPEALPRLTAGTVTITPPAYTGRSPRRVDRLEDAEVEEGATVSWELTFDRPVRDLRLVFGRGQGDPLPLVPTTAAAGDAVRFTTGRAFTETVLYHLAATLPDGRAWNPPDLYSLRVIRDRPPAVRVVRPEVARTVLDPPPAGQPSPRVEVEVAATDDYGTGEVRLVATVAKGSGEAVKFREQALPFDADTVDPAAPPGSHARRLTRMLDLGALGMEPGDELYFHAEVDDRHEPAPNRARSETRFIVLRGPEEAAPSVGKGVTGINLVPQYFRSQRQIIIDTEKLIADRPGTSRAELMQRANDLGGDQQLLRLRYGQFLGEELEEPGDHEERDLHPLRSGPPERAAGFGAAASIAMRFRQEHESQAREGGPHEEREAFTRPAPDVLLTPGQIVAPFVDQHDSQDKATFFDHETKGTLRDALGAMWEAERFLRIAKLEEALVPANRALEILKNLQQSARAYVQRVGFEPPPLKVAERRFKGDVADVPPVAARADTLPPGDPALAAVRRALATLPWHRSPPVALSVGDAGLLETLEPALTAAATDRPDRFLAGLQALRQLRAGGSDGVSAQLPALEAALLRLLPPATWLPSRGLGAATTLSRAYAEALAEPAKEGDAVR